MQTECTSEPLLFQDLGRREVRGDFSGGAISSDGGVLLLRELECRRGILKRFSECFVDFRRVERIEHTVEELVKQRVMGLALGYEDLNDHDDLRFDPLLAVACGKGDPTGQSRRHSGDQGKALAGKSTLNRLELGGVGVPEGEVYKKIIMDTEAVDRLFVDLFLESQRESPERIIIDVDATDDPLHGHQEGRFFHGYYDSYCYLPLYIFCGDQLLCARLRRSNIDGSAGSLDELQRIVSRIRDRWPRVEIVIRGDSGFCREELMAWCEGESGVYYLFGLARNNRLESLLSRALDEARELYEAQGSSSRIFHEFPYRTLNSWSRSRRVVGKAEYGHLGPNPRFIVTNLPEGERSGREWYEDVYCARGDMENRIKEQQLDLFADRTSTHTMRGNQIRLYFASLAYTLLEHLRRLGLQESELARAQCGTIRTKLLKLGAHIRITVRKVWISFSSAYPYWQTFRAVYERLRSLAPCPP